MGSGAFLIRNIPQGALTELKDRVPDFPEWPFSRAVSAYIDARENKHPTPKAIRDELDVIAETAIALCSLLSARTQALSDYLRAGEMRHGAKGLTNRIIPDLRNLMEIAEAARRDADANTGAGRSLSCATELVAELVSALREEGFEVTSKPNDRLVLAFSIALRAAGEAEKIADPARTVASALKTLKGRNAKQ